MHKQEIRSLLCSMLLGKSYIKVSNFKPVVSGDFRTEHSLDQKDYALWKADQIDQIFKKKKLERRCNVDTRKRVNKKTGNEYKNVVTILSWKTYIKHLYKWTYKHRRKDVKYLLSQMRYDKCLAILMMDIGFETKETSKHEDGDTYYRNPSLCVGSSQWTKGECQLIKEWFERKYKVSPMINQYKQQFVLQLSIADSKRLFPHIRPYVVNLESMRQKFCLCIERY